MSRRPATDLGSPTPRRVVADGGHSECSMPTANIMVFDDSRLSRTVIGRHLASLGFIVTPAATAAEAASAIEGGAVDVAVIGYTSHSPDAVDVLLCAGRSAAVPVVLITTADAVRRLPADVLLAVTEALARGRFSLAELERILIKVAGER
jgi:CheY-like chemotaxis protein